MTKSSELQAWRELHSEELDATLKVLKGIRDDTEASNKDRIEASKSIARMMAAMSPGKPPVAAAQNLAKDKPTLSPEHQKGLDEILDTIQ
jgi:hypothetical protein